MARYRVMLRCESLTILLEEEPREVGFFTTRAVDAPSQAAAIETAKAWVRGDLASRTTDDPASLLLEVEDVSGEAWWWRRLRPPKGFTFFYVDEDQFDRDTQA